MLFIAFYSAAQLSISDVHIHLKKITYKLYYIVIVCLLSYIIYSGLNLFALFVTTASPFLSCQVYIPSIIHINKRIYFQFYLSIFGRPRYIIKVAQKTATHGSVIFPLDWVFIKTQYFNILMHWAFLPSVPATVKQPLSMRLLPAHFTFGMVLCMWWAVPAFLQKWSL